MPRTIIAGNWKMHFGPSETRTFLQEFRAPPEGGGLEIVVFPPAISLAAAREQLGAEASIRLGAQNVHWEERGAFTGETAVGMVREYDAEYVLAGHSERRHLFHETDEAVARKVGTIVRAGLRAVACGGETLDERDAGRLEDILLRQLDAILDGLPDNDDVGKLVLAYEPVWAIGTGRTATPEDASEAHGLLRSRLEKDFERAVAAEVPILYGGSVKPENAGELLATENVNGVLVGGASLDPDAFRAIAEAAPAAG